MNDDDKFRDMFAYMAELFDSINEKALGTAEADMQKAVEALGVPAGTSFREAQQKYIETEYERLAFEEEQQRKQEPPLVIKPLIGRRKIIVR